MSLGADAGKLQRMVLGEGGLLLAIGLTAAPIDPGAAIRSQ